MLGELRLKTIRALPGLRVIERIVMFKQDDAELIILSYVPDELKALVTRYLKLIRRSSFLYGVMALAITHIIISLVAAYL